MQALITCLVAGSQYLIHPHTLVRKASASSRVPAMR